MCPRPFDVRKNLRRHAPSTHRQRAAPRGISSPFFSFAMIFLPHPKRKFSRDEPCRRFGPAFSASQVASRRSSSSSSSNTTRRRRSAKAYHACPVSAKVLPHLFPDVEEMRSNIKNPKHTKREKKKKRLETARKTRHRQRLLRVSAVLCPSKTARANERERRASFSPTTFIILERAKANKSKAQRERESNLSTRFRAVGKTRGVKTSWTTSRVARSALS